MLKRIDKPALPEAVKISAASFPSPFAGGLQYSVPARGGWTIVHVGMLIPEAHEIFVCADGCLRGVVLSAAEMGLTDRFSTVAIEEHNVVDGDMEQLFTEGVTDILNRLPALPPAVLVYSSCIHHFMGCDLDTCFKELRSRFPGVDFTDCYMTPTMRNGALNPDRMMRSRLYTLLRDRDADDRFVTLVGNLFSYEESNDIVRLVRASGRELLQITGCGTYAEYQELAKGSLFIHTQSVSSQAARELSGRFNRKSDYLPVSYAPDEIRANLKRLADALGCGYDGDDETEKAACKALDKAAMKAGNMPVAIDALFTDRPVSLALLLLEHGFNVDTLFVDSFAETEREGFDRLRSLAPDITVYPTIAPGMRKFRRAPGPEYLAFGQKAAYFTGTTRFVNLVEDAGLYGFDGIRRLAGLIVEAIDEPKNTEELISVKGLGCESCI